MSRYMYLEKVKKKTKYSTHNVSIQWALKKKNYVVKFEKIHELPGSPLPSSLSTVGFALEQLTEGLISNPQTNPRNFPYTSKWCSYEPDINK